MEVVQSFQGRQTVILRILRDSPERRWFQGCCMSLMPSMAPAAFQKLLKDDWANSAKVVKAADVRIE